MAFEPMILSPLEHAMPTNYFSVLLSFTPDNPSACIPSLQKGVEKLILRLPHLAGELIINANLDGREHIVHIQPSTIPTDHPMLAIKHHKSSMPSLKDSASCDKPAMEYQYLCPLPKLIASSEYCPVARFQANLFADGLILAMSIPHNVTDAQGAADILAILADCCRGISDDRSLLEERVVKRKEIFNRDYDILNPRDHTKDFILAPLLPDLSSEQISETLAVLAKSIHHRRFKFPASRVMDLKQRCLSLLPTLPDTPAFVSRNDVVTAVLTVCIQRVRNKLERFPKTNKTALSMALDFRKRINLPSCENYTGNLVCLFQIKADLHFVGADFGNEHEPPTEDMKAITSTASMLRQRVQTTDEEYFYSLISWFNAQTNWKNLGVQPADVLISSWRHLTSYELDFGSAFGRVMDFDLSFGFIDGLCFLLPSSDGGEGWEVHMHLGDDEFRLLFQDGLFRWMLGDV